MTELMITGSSARRGEIDVAGAKNASLPLMAACLLTQQEVKLKNVPEISDIDDMKKQLESYGVEFRGSGSTASPLVLKPQNARASPRNDSGKKIRGAFLVLGPLLARFGEAKVYVPGGCKIGQSGRPVDFHINALEKMGAREVQSSGDYYHLKAVGGLRGAEIHFPKISVGATENIVMAACLADGRTTITNAAVEPEVIDLVDMLKEMGANIQVNQGRNVIVIHGRREFLSGTTHTVIPDRIEAGSYAIVAAIVGGPLLLKMDPRKAREILVPIVEKLQEAGVDVTWKHNGLEVRRSGRIHPVSITTGPYPEFPTDLLPQWTTLMTQAQGRSRMTDMIYDGRFKHVPYLGKMGAGFTKISESIYDVHGGAKLTGTHVKATDLRAGFALVIAASAAKGTTVVKEFHHVHRGYEKIKEKLIQCGLRFEELRPTRSGFFGGLQ